MSLTKTEKKGRAAKERLIENVRSCLDEYPLLFVFKLETQRNQLLKEVRGEFMKTSRYEFICREDF